MRTFLAVILLLLFLSPLQAGILLDRVVAIVDRDVITWSELYKRIEFDFSDRLQHLSAEQKREFIEAKQRDYIQRIVDIYIQLKEAEKEGIKVSDDEVDRAIEEIRNKYGLNAEQFKEAVNRQGLTMQEYRRLVKEQIIINKLVSYKIHSNVVVTEDEIQQYLKENPSEQVVSEGFVLRDIFIKNSEGLEDKLRQVQKELSSGVPFDVVARRYSEGANRDEGGAMGLVRANELNDLFLSALKDTQEGQYTQPIYTDRGVHILYLERRLSADASVKDRAMQALKEKKFQQMYRDWLRELRGKYYIEIKL